MYEEKLFLLDVDFMLDQPLDWLQKINLSTGGKESVFGVPANELGNGIVLTGRSAGYGEVFCHIAVFSGLLACFSA
ncbi:MAG: hypothetical protein LAT67_15815 [Balneolales bacterium]|nr:hypothetical protein [Balneolales bacterium]